MVDDLRPPRLESPWFGEEGGQFARLSRVLQFTARRWCPEWAISVRRIEPADLRSPLGVKSHADNTAKMVAWNGIVQGAADGDQVLLIDSDTMILRPLDDVWNRPFDMAYTVKEGRFPFNSGVVFLRVSDKTRAFAEEWNRENLRLLNTPRDHQRWRAVYGGCNQAALGAMLEGGLVKRLDLQLERLPCVEWNNEDSSWASFDPARTRIVHIKSGLRRAVFGFGPVMARLRPLVTVWRHLEREAGGGPTPAPPVPSRAILAPRPRAADMMRARARAGRLQGRSE